MNKDTHRLGKDDVSISLEFTPRHLGLLYPATAIARRAVEVLARSTSSADRPQSFQAAGSVPKIKRWPCPQAGPWPPPPRKDDEERVSHITNSGGIQPVNFDETHASSHPSDGIGQHIRLTARSLARPGSLTGGE